jgi:hypothetical protein
LQLNSTHHFQNSITCNTDQNKIAKRPKEQALEAGSKKPTLREKRTKIEGDTALKKLHLHLSHKFSTKKDYTNSAAKAPQHLQSKNKSSRMPVMSVRDEREKLKRVSPLWITTELPTEWTTEKMEYTRDKGFALARYCFLHIQQSQWNMFFIVLLNSI